MNTEAITRRLASAPPTPAAAAIPLADFYCHLLNHDWYYSFSDDSSVYSAGEATGKRLEQMARDGGPVYEWLLSEAIQSYYSGSPWSTPKHPMPPAPTELTLVDAIHLRADMAKAELHQLAIDVAQAFLPAKDTNTASPVAAILRRVRYYGAYAGTDSAPTLIAGHPKLLAAWQLGQQHVADGDHPTT